MEVLNQFGIREPWGADIDLHGMSNNDCPSWRFWMDAGMDWHCIEEREESVFKWNNMSSVGGAMNAIVHLKMVEEL
jgi:hypothetical protein